MTDANGSATAITPNAGIPDPTKGGGGDGSSATASDALSGLDDPGIREWLGKAGFKDLTPASFKSLAVKARDAESLIGKSVRLPAADAKPEDWKQFFAKAGVPETPDGYQFARPEELPEEQFQSDAKAFAAKLHKIGTPKVLAEQIAGEVFGEAAAAIKAENDREATAKTAATATLVKEFGGDVGSEAFKANIGLAQKAISTIGGEDAWKALEAAGLVGDDGSVLDPAFVIGFAKLGKSLFKEGDVVRGDPSGDTGNNPFKDGPDKGNQTVQMQMIAKDRPRAEMLMRQAGRDPAEWNLKAA